MGEPTLLLHLRSQTLTQDAGGHNQWQIAETEQRLPASRLAFLLCDMWDAHWSRGASERVDALVPRLNDVVRAARALGVQIVHAPSDVVDFYAGTPARQRALDLPRVEPPVPLPHDDPPLPIDDSDGGSDTGETPWHKAWTRQHPGIEIDHSVDLISDDGTEVYSLLRQRPIARLLIAGVHTNMCVLRRPFAIAQMARWGVEVALVRDLTDAMYNPAMPPYVSHTDGKQLVIAYIEKFWCPTIHSRDLLDAPRNT
jgi:nicotinamidase-related amidase